MAQGINGDLADITVYTATTPVHFTDSNVPLTELDANILVLDTKLEGYMESGQVAFSEAGDGTFNSPVVLTTTANTTPRVTTGLADVHANATGKLVVEISSRTTSGFTINVIASGTGGAWTANVQWFSDGR